KGRSPLPPTRTPAAVPAEPAIPAHVENALGVAIDLDVAHAAPAAILPALVRHVAGCAQHAALRRKARLEEKLLAERNCLRMAGDPVRRVGFPGRRPGAMAQDRANFLRGEVDRVRDAGCRCEDKREEADPHSIGMLSAMRSPSMSNRNCHRPGMWNISPVA